MKKKHVNERASDTYPLVSIVILNWNRLDDTKLCIEYVRKLDYPNYEIILVDNGSVDGSKEYFRNNELGDIIYIDNPKNRGFTGGQIDGYKQSHGEYVVLLNNDAVIKQDYLSRALQLFKDPKVGIVGGKAFWWNESNKIFDEANSFYSFQEIDVKSGDARTLDSDNDMPQVVNNVSGSCMIVRRELVHHIGYLHNRFFAYFEETDLCARAKRAGYKVVYDPSLCIWHRNGASSGSSGGSYFFYYQMFRNRFIFATRNFESGYMLRMWRIYFRDARRATIDYYAHRGNEVLNRAFMKAATSNILQLPRTMYSRISLRFQLGKSTYNHIIYSEQLGISIIVDGSNLDQSALLRLLNKLYEDTNPLHEYIIVTNFKPKKVISRENVSIVTNRHDTSPYYAGIESSTHPWIVFCENNALRHINLFHESLVHNLDNNVGMVLFGDKLPASRKPYVIINKAFLNHVGGFDKQDISPVSLDQLAGYAHIMHCLLQIKINDSSQDIPLNALERSRIASLGSTINFRLDWPIESQKKYEKLLKYVQSQQIYFLIKWLLKPDVKLRLKVARLKNLLVYTLLMQHKLLSVEFTHIRNEALPKQ